MFGKTRRFKQDAAGGPIALPALSGPAFESLPVAGAQSDKPNLPPARRGVFGRMGAYFTPERLSLLASAFSSDPDAYGSERERQYTMRTAEAERLRAEQEMEQTRRTAKDRNEELRGFINQAYPDDPEGQRLAWLSPQSAVTERLRNRQGPEFGAPETISGRLAQRNTRTGEIEWAPQLTQGDGGGGRPPVGYRYTADGNLEAIPGGPADIRASAEGRAQAGRLQSSADSLDNAINVLDEAADLVNPGSSGMIGQITRGMGGTAAYDLNQALEPVRAILSFENLAEMRRNSATGGALGSIAVRELELLGNTVRSLDTAQSPAQLARAISTTQTQLSRTRTAILRAQAELGDNEEMPAAQAQQVAPQRAAPSAGVDIQNMSIEELRAYRERVARGEQ